MCYYGNVMTTTRWWLCVTILHLQQYSHRLNWFFFCFLGGFFFWHHLLLHFTFRTQRASGFLFRKGRARFEPRNNAEHLKHVGVLNNTDVLPGLQILATTLQWTHSYSYARLCSATAKMRRKCKVPEAKCFHFFVLPKFTWYQVG